MTHTLRSTDNPISLGVRLSLEQHHEFYFERLEMLSDYDEPANLTEFINMHQPMHVQLFAPRHIVDNYINAQLSAVRALLTHQPMHIMPYALQCAELIMSVLDVYISELASEFDDDSVTDLIDFRHSIQKLIIDRSHDYAQHKSK